MWRVVEKIMKHFINKENLGLVCNREAKKAEAVGNSYFITNKIIDGHFIDNIAYLFPLYLYNEDSALLENKTLNLNEEIIKMFEKKLNLAFKPAFSLEPLAKSSETTFNEIDVIAYIYAILYNPTYRKKYSEFLKIDFPRVPYPNKKTFFKYVEFGKKLINLHLKKESFDKVVEFVGSDTTIEKINKKSISYNNDNVEIKINKTSKLIIPKKAFEFFIGGYQVVLKFLKEHSILDRNTFKELNQIVDILIKTDKIMQIKEDSENRRS